jgi:hypothetical protein
MKTRNKTRIIYSNFSRSIERKKNKKKNRKKSNNLFLKLHIYNQKKEIR